MMLSTLHNTVSHTVKHRETGIQKPKIILPINDLKKQITKSTNYRTD